MERRPALRPPGPAVARDHQRVTEEPSGWDRRRQLLLGEYERVALELFADRGFHTVTVDEIAEAAAVSPRTLFRYFATKEDMLLALPRRGLAAATASLARLAADPEPLPAAWRHLRGSLGRLVPDPALAVLWRRAANGAPDVVARVRGERVEGMIDALSDFIARSLGVDPARDGRVRIYGGLLAGIDLAMLESLGRFDDDYGRIFDSAERALRALMGPPG